MNDTPTEREPTRHLTYSDIHAGIEENFNRIRQRFVFAEDYDIAIRERDEAIKLAERITSRAALNEAAREKAESELAEARRERDAAYLRGKSEAYAECEAVYRSQRAAPAPNVNDL